MLGGAGTVIRAPAYVILKSIFCCSLCHPASNPSHLCHRWRPNDAGKRTQTAVKGLFVSYQPKEPLVTPPLNYEELVKKQYFPMSECMTKSLVATMYLSWLPHCHNMADFLTYFPHFSFTPILLFSEDKIWIENAKCKIYCLLGWGSGLRRRKRGGSKNWEAPAPSIQTYSRIRMIDQDQIKMRMMIRQKVESSSQFSCLFSDDIFCWIVSLGSRQCLCSEDPPCCLSAWDQGSRIKDQGSKMRDQG